MIQILTKTNMISIRKTGICVLLLLFFLSDKSFAQPGQKLRPIALLDLSSRNGDNPANINSIEFMAQVAGIPYIITANISVAIQHNIIVSSSIFKHSTFTAVEKDSLINYVDSGGILIVPAIKDTYLYSLFGISDNSTSNTNFSIKWNWQSSDYSFRWIDDTCERTISLGDSLIYPDGVIQSRSYIPTTGSVLALYADNSVAAVKNNYGQGSTYAFGLDFSDMITRNQRSYDYEAQRHYSNYFEPSSDVFFLMIKAIYAYNTPFATWKHTCPWDKRYELMMSHDIDAFQSMDTMHYYADYEYENQINATYFVTTHYFSDYMDGDYYSGNIPKLIYVRNLNQTIGSHSVGHFPDFNDIDIVPEGGPGNTEANYHPYYSEPDGQTIDATVFGECEVSKNLLESDLGVDVRSFRCGYLAYPEVLPDVLDSLGYSYNSSYTANDVLTNFPYREYKSLSTDEKLTKIREIPISFDVDYSSDALSPSNYVSRANRWLGVIQKISNNYAPVLFLLHPVAYYKLLLEEYLYQNMPEGYIKMELGEFGDYWQAREDFNFTTVMLNDSVIQVTVPDNLFSLSDKLSLIINNGQSLSSIIVKDQSGDPVSFFQSNWETNDLCIYFYPNTTGITENNKTNHLEFIKNYPNPFKTSTSFEYFLTEKSHVKIQIFDESFREVSCLLDKDENEGSHTIGFSPEHLNSGLYFYSMTTDNGRYSGKMILMK